jgi:hypothetical protein
MPFQTAVNLQQAPAQAGDFCSANPRSSLLAGAGQLVAGTNGLLVGQFAWIDATGTFANSTGTGAPNGFVHRGSNMAMITAYLGEVSNLVPAGMGVTLHSTGDFWMRTTTASTIGQKVFVNNTTGAISTGAAGATVAGASESKWYVWSVQNAGELMKTSTVSPT